MEVILRKVSKKGTPPASFLCILSNSFLITFLLFLSSLLPPLFLFVTALQIVFETFLEDINNILSVGEVPNLFSQKDDYPLIKDKVRKEYIKFKQD